MKEIVIKIPEDMYRAIKDDTYCGVLHLTLYDAIKNGKVLPKGHDALLDRGEILKHEVFARIGEDYEEYAVPVDCIGEIIPIIEADEEANDE